MKNNSKTLIWGSRVFFLSILGMILTKLSIFPDTYLGYFIVLFNVTFIIFGIGFFSFQKDKNFIATNILASSLVLIGLTFSIIWTLGRIYHFPLNSPIMTGSAIIFMISILGTMVGGLSYK